MEYSTRAFLRTFENLYKREQAWKKRQKFGANELLPVQAATILKYGSLALESQHFLGPFYIKTLILLAVVLLVTERAPALAWRTVNF